MARPARTPDPRDPADFSQPPEAPHHAPRGRRLSDEEWAGVEALFGTVEFDPEYDPFASRPHLP